jgi:hypothetical protein
VYAARRIGIAYAQAQTDASPPPRAASAATQGLGKS